MPRRAASHPRFTVVIHLISPVTRTLFVYHDSTGPQAAPGAILATLRIAATVAGIGSRRPFDGNITVTATGNTKVGLGAESGGLIDSSSPMAPVFVGAFAYLGFQNFN